LETVFFPCPWKVSCTTRISYHEFSNFHWGSGFFLFQIDSSDRTEWDGILFAPCRFLFQNNVSGFELIVQWWGVNWTIDLGQKSLGWARPGRKHGLYPSIDKSGDETAAHDAARLAPRGAMVGGVEAGLAEGLRCRGGSARRPETTARRTPAGGTAAAMASAMRGDG
jgi:hypothetical protein